MTTEEFEYHADFMREERLLRETPIFLLPGHFGDSKAWISWCDEDGAEHFPSPVTIEVMV